MTEIVGCSVIREKYTLYMHQWELIRCMENSFSEEVKQSVRVYHTAGAKGVGILKLSNEEEKLKAETQTKYRSGASMVFFLVKYLRPDIKNYVLELRKGNNCAGKMHFNELVQ